MSRRSSKTVDRGMPWAEVGPRAFLEPLARILNISGCHPRDLQREFVRICRELPKPKRAWGPMRPSYLADLSHVIARWHADEQYVDADGRPLPLPLEGPEPSLKGLISRVLPGIDPEQPMQWLMRLEGIRRRGKRFLPTDKYLAFNRSPAASWAHGLTAVLGILSTVEHNISARTQSRLLERIAHQSEVSGPRAAAVSSQTQARGGGDLVALRCRYGTGGDPAERGAGHASLYWALRL